MNIIVVDDEPIVLEGEVSLISWCRPDAKVWGFSSPREALAKLPACAADVAFLDLSLPEMDGVQLAKELKQRCPHLNIIFATAYSDRYDQALRLRASGYLLKPLRLEQVREELDNLRFPVRRYEQGLFIRAFGNFEVFYDGKPVLFRYLKTKELFAYLIDRKGALVSRDELITMLWGGETDRTSYYKQIQNDLQKVLKEARAEPALVKQRGGLGIIMKEVCCDYFDLLQGLPAGLNAFAGEYMRQYDWAEPTWVNLMNARGALTYDPD